MGNIIQGEDISIEKAPRYYSAQCIPIQSAYFSKI